MADVIDISIKQLNDKIKKDSDIETFLNSEVMIEEKTDGVKITLYLKEDADMSKPYYENWVVAYKGQVLYPDEYTYQNDEDIKKDSIGSSQYKFVFDALKDHNIGVNVLEKGCQYFCEYLIKKPTLSSNYLDLYNLILLAYGKSSYEIKNGMLMTNNKDFKYDETTRVQYAKAMGWYTPPKVFQGKLNSDSIMGGILNNDLRNKIEPLISNLSNLKPKEYLYKIEELFLETESQFGNIPEGYVVHYNGMYKFQQTFQIDKEARLALKMKFKGSVLEESVYWTDVKSVADDLFNKTKSTNFEKSLSKLSLLLKDFQVVFTHPKKNDTQIKDDIQLTTKLMFIREFADKWSLVQGKFRILTTAHYNMIKDALNNSDGVVINVVSNKDTKKYLKLRLEALELSFEKEIKKGKIEIIQSSTGNINTVLRKTYNQIFHIYTGTDRIEEYQTLVDKYNIQAEIREIIRSDKDISASKIESNIEDENYFKENTPKEIHSLYDEYLKLFK